MHLFAHTHTHTHTCTSYPMGIRIHIGTQTHRCTHALHRAMMCTVHDERKMLFDLKATISSLACKQEAVNSAPTLSVSTTMTQLELLA